MSQLIPQLADLIAKDNAILFVGTSLNSAQRQTLVQRMADALAQRIQYAKSDRSLPAIARDFEALRGRNALLLALREEIERSSAKPDTIHQLIADAVLPHTKVITTRFDRLLEQAFESYQKPYVLIVRDSDVSFFDETKVTLIKIQGDISQPDSLVVTEDDVNDFIDKLPTLSDLVRAYFATKTLIFLGYDLESEQFKRLFRQVTRNLSIYRRTAYAVIPSEMDEATRRYWANQSIEILQQEPVPFLEKLSAAVWSAVRQPSQPDQTAAQAHSLPLPPTPYKGLSHFSRADAPIFFGRQQEIRLLTNRLLANRLVLLYGENGVGKSSLIRAGLSRSLSEHRAALVIIEPQTNDSLSETMLQGMAAFARSHSELRLSVEPGQSVMERIQSWQQTLGGPVILALDQAEAFVQRLALPVGNQANGDQANGVQANGLNSEDLALLGQLLMSQSLDLRLLIALREEALAQLSPIENLLPNQQQAQFRLERLGLEAARESLTSSAALFRLEWSDAVLRALLSQLDEREAGGILPVRLQIVYQRLVLAAQEVESNRLTDERWEALGGARQILVDYLRDTLDRLPLNDQPLAHTLLGGLVTTGGGKLRLDLASLVRISGAPPQRVADLLSHLDRLYLVRTLLPRRENFSENSGDGSPRPENAQLHGNAEPHGNDEHAPLPRYELAHAFLAQALTAWLGEQFWATQKVREVLRSAAPEWESRQRLLPPDDLALAQRIAQELVPTQREQELLYASAIAWRGEGQPWQNSIEAARQRTLLLSLSQSSQSEARANSARLLVAFPDDETVTQLLTLALNDAQSDVIEGATQTLADWSQSSGAAQVGASVQAIRHLAELTQQEAGETTEASWRLLTHIRDRSPGSAQLLPAEIRRAVQIRTWRLRWQTNRLPILQATLSGMQGGFWGFGLGIGIFLGLSRFIADGFTLALIAQRLDSILFGITAGIPIMGVLGGVATGLSSGGGRLWASLADTPSKRALFGVRVGLGVGSMALLWLLFAFVMPGNLNVWRSLAAGAVIGLGLYPAATQTFITDRRLVLVVTALSSVVAFLLAWVLGLIFVGVAWWLIWMGIAAGLGVAWGLWKT